MRRDPTAENGLVQLMVASLAERAAAFGVGRVSLNFAMFREAFERGAEVGAGPIARVWRQALLLAEPQPGARVVVPWFSTGKYLPEAGPRFICFEYASDLPRVGTAAGSAERFLTRPSLSMLHRRRGSYAAGEPGAGRRCVRRRGAGSDPIAPDLLAEAMSAHQLPQQMRVRRDKLQRIKERASTLIRSATHGPTRWLRSELEPASRHPTATPGSSSR